MTIGRTSYGIHGTNVRWSIGRTATHGCIRLYEDQIVRLFDRVPEGTRVQLVYAPFKWGSDGTRIYLEVHPDLYGKFPDRLAAALATPRALGLLDRIDLGRAWTLVDEARGVPTDVGHLAR
jgi:L,D-transpeptidase ErfK/SrfK